MTRVHLKLICFFVSVFTFFTIALLLGYATYVVMPFKKNIDIKVEGDRIITNDDIIGFVATKSAASFRQHGRSLAYHIFTDERGARVNAVGLSTPNEVSIMTIGCSFSWGHGVENSDTYTAILGQSLDVPVVNFAMGSYGMLHAVQILERNLDLKPKIIVYGFIEDQIRRSLSPCAPSYAPFCLSVSYVAFNPQGHPYIHAPNMPFSPEVAQQFLDDVAKSHFGLIDILWGAKIALFRITQKKMFTYSNTEQSRLKCTAFLMNKMIELAKSINAILIVIHIPYLENGSTNTVSSELVNSLSQDTLLIDLSSVVRDYYQNPENPDLRLNKNDGHPNTIAHKLIADEIQKVIKTKNIRFK